MKLENKKMLKNHFFYYWYVYIIFVVVVSVLVGWITNLIVGTKIYEKSCIFIGSIKADKEAIKEVMRKNDDTLREAVALTYSPLDGYFETYLTSAGVTNTDLVILPDVYMKEDILQQYFINFHYYKNKFDTLYNFNYEELTFRDGVNPWVAIKVYDKNENYSLFSSLITYNNEKTTYGKYYLLVNKQTCNMNSIIPYNGNSSDHATISLKNLLANEK